MKNLSDILIAVGNQIEQGARNIYYGMSFLPEDHPARANLKLALEELGINRPKDVGLSDSVLKGRNVPQG